jgi:hypothetical protein
MTFVITKLITLILGTGLNLGGSFILAKTMVKSESEISDMSTTFWNGNPLMEKILKKDRKKAIIGLTLFIPGIILQIIYAIMEVIITIS